jgi:hypothetical protein
VQDRVFAQSHSMGRYRAAERLGCVPFDLHREVRRRTNRWKEVLLALTKLRICLFSALVLIHTSERSRGWNS